MTDLRTMDFLCNWLPKIGHVYRTVKIQSVALRTHTDSYDVNPIREPQPVISVTWASYALSFAFKS